MVLSDSCTISLSRKLVSARLEEILEEGSIISGRKLRENNYKLFSRFSYGELAMIDKYHYYIDVSLEGQDITTLAYRIRGNQTYQTIGVVLGIFLLIPVLMLIGSSIPAEMEEGILILFLFLLILAGTVAYFLARSTRALERKAESLLLFIIEKIEAT